MTVNDLPKSQVVTFTIDKDSKEEYDKLRTQLENVSVVIIKSYDGYYKLETSQHPIEGEVADDCKITLKSKIDFLPLAD